MIDRCACGNGVGIVYFSETRDRRDFTFKMLEVFKEPLKRAGKVFVKPNVVSSEPYPTTTHPDVLDAVLNRSIDTSLFAKT